MRRRSTVLIAAILLAGCASRGRVHSLEVRLARSEQQAAARELELRAALLRVEAQLTALGLASIGGGADEALATRLEALERRLDQVAAARPPVRPSRSQADPTKTYAVPVAGDPFRGKADALVTIVRAGEYACPYCEKVRPTLDQLVADYPREVRIVHKDFIVHPQTATDAAHAACAAHKQGKFLAMDALLWDRAFKGRRFERAFIETLAGELGLDLDQYRADLTGPCPGEVQADQAQLAQVGVSATPAFFINGRFLSGAQPYAAFKALVDEELALAQGRVKQGTKRKHYYDTWVVAAGLPRLAPVPQAGP